MLIVYSFPKPVAIVLAPVSVTVFWCLSPGVPEGIKFLFINSNF